MKAVARKDRGGEDEDERLILDLKSRRGASSSPVSREHCVAPEVVPVTVLLAEDDVTLRRLLARELRQAGYGVVEACDGRELLDCLATGKLRGAEITPDLIVSDVRMPGWSGLEVLGGLRDTDWATPVILITAFGSPDLHAEARRLGARRVLNKPFDLQELTTAIGELLSPKIE